MRKHIGLFAFVILGAAMMYGQASRTWVSGVGDDANPCSRTAPCKTFAGAISKTAPGGEIDALDPGGFGALTITKAITLDGGGGQVASVLVAGTNAIVVAAGPSDVVIIRNIRINGIVGSGNGGTNGIRFLSGKDLDVEKCDIFDFSTNGIDIALGASGATHVLDTVIQNVGGVGVRATTTAGTATVGIDHSQITLSGNIGVEAASNSKIVLNNSLVQHSTNAGVQADNPSSTTAGQVTVSNSDVSHNNPGGSTSSGGLVSTAGGSANTYNSNYAYNGGCSLNNNAGNSVVSFGCPNQCSNRIVGPANCGTISPAPLQ